MSDYWDNEWVRREAEGSGRLPKLNIDKAEKLLLELWNRLYYFPLEKLEIGCGPAVHAYKIGTYSHLWKDTWTGIDSSEEAVRIAQKNGMNAHCVDIMDYNPNGKKFQVFLLLDVLEHLEHPAKVAERIYQLSQTPYYVFLNVPLYLSLHDEEVENPVSIITVRHFMTLCGCTEMKEHVYGCRGFPYMWAEGRKLA